MHWWKRMRAPVAAASAAMMLGLVSLLLAGCGGAEQSAYASVLPSLPSPNSSNASPAVSTAKANDALAPAQVASAFYAIYLATQPGNSVDPPDSKYQNSPYLTTELKSKVEGALAVQRVPGIDPLVCSATRPASVQVEQATVSQGSAEIRLRTSPAGSTFRLAMTDSGGRWRISDVVCPLDVAAAPSPGSTSGPRAIVSSFYSWYTSAGGQGALRRGEYRQRPELSEQLITRIDDMTADTARAGGDDPFVCAPAVPVQIIVGAAALRGEQAVVPVATGGSAASFEVQLVSENGGWQIDAIRCSVTALPTVVPAARMTPTPSAGENSYTDSEFQISLNYPAEWRVTAIPTQVPPASAPLKRVVGFQPRTAPAELIPVRLEIYSSSEEEFNRTLAGLGTLETVTVAGRTVQRQVDQSGSGSTFYIFSDPLRPQIHVVLRFDANPGDSAPGGASVILPMVTSFRFAP
jgi:hypothetical protein